MNEKKEKKKTNKRGLKQAYPSNSMSHPRDFRIGVTERRTYGRTDDDAAKNVG